VHSTLASAADCGAEGEEPAVEGVAGAVLAAARAGDADALAALLRAGASPDVADARGCTPLMLAADCGSLEATRVLLAHGADAGAEDEDGETAADYADVCGYPELADVLHQSRIRAVPTAA